MRSNVTYLYEPFFWTKQRLFVASTSDYTVIARRAAVPVAFAVAVLVVVAVASAPPAPVAVADVRKIDVVILTLYRIRKHSTVIRHGTQRGKRE